MKVVTAEQMRNIDRLAAQSGITTEFLMENAGRCVAEETRNLGTIAGRSILAFTGPGNNGGDALVSARYLQDWGAEVTAYLLSTRTADDKNMQLAKEHGVNIIYAEKDTKFAKLKSLLSSTDIVIDGILGTGKARPIKGLFKNVLINLNGEKFKRPDITVVAVDIPTGLDADTGQVDPGCVQADLTITLGLPKLGLYNFPGAERAGKKIIADIGIPAKLSQDIPTELITPEWCKSVFPPRPANATKGSFGRMLAVVGSENYIGAAYLACMGAARVGAGVVTLATAGSLQPVLASKLTEVTYAPLPEVRKCLASHKASKAILSILPYYRILLMGCGSGQHVNTKEFIKGVLLNLPEQSPPLVLDADALNTLSEVNQWWRKLNSDAIVTPHAGEMARLLGVSINKVQSNRLETARKAAAKWKKVVVLKGAYTVIAEPGGRARICDAANPGLATAGTGDVLAGAIAGLAAQSIPLYDAASLGVYLHATAGAEASDEIGDTGMLASDLLPVLPRIIKKLKAL
ncbi:MAG: NAD(P)H-hydrate dehydratase [Dehalococcoidia bacterium]|nr:NAD(P)H-hydrate dehydratase [Dehalococcoidia bacterium]MDD5495173.1 NAD(P)H-hydrate dehydratase [Dehalococcoidia bacterium]